MSGTFPKAMEVIAEYNQEKDLQKLHEAIQALRTQLTQETDDDVKYKLNKELEMLTDFMSNLPEEKPIKPEPLVTDIHTKHPRLITASSGEPEVPTDRTITTFSSADSATIFFQGKFEANPNTSNNGYANNINKGSLALYKVGKDGQLTSQYTDEEFRKWQEGDSNARSWNLYGSHSFQIHETKVTAGRIDFVETKEDPLVGTPVSLFGHELATQRITPKMVDQGLDILTSQIFADKLVIGNQDNNMTITLPTGNFRTYNPKQISVVDLNKIPNEFASGNFFFNCRSQDVRFHGSSPLLDGFREALANKFGARVWFVLMNTIHAPKNTFLNSGTPAFGSLFGWITTVEFDHEHKLEDRYLIPVASGMINEKNDGGAVPMFINTAKKFITLDMMMAVPFQGRDDTMCQSKCTQIIAEFNKFGVQGAKNPTKISAAEVPVLGNREPWSLYLKFKFDNGPVTDLGIIPLETAAQAVNNNVVNLKYEEEIEFSQGTFFIVDEQDRTLFQEREINYYVAKPFVYMEHYDKEIHPMPFKTDVHAFKRGKSAPNQVIYLFPFNDLEQYPDNDFSSTEQATWNNTTPIMLKFKSFDATFPLGSVGQVVTDKHGKASIDMFGTGSGALIVTMRPEKFSATKTDLSLGDYISENWFAVRILSYDAHLLQVPYSQRITWNFVYNHVLRYYHLVYPFMSDRILSLQCEENAKGYALFMYKATCKDAFTQSWYMPASRELSDIRRQILHDYLSSFSVITTDVPPVKHEPLAVQLSQDFQVFTREQLLYQLCQAAEQEHGLMLQYLFAAYSLKDLPEENLPADVLKRVVSVKEKITHIAQQEMLHFGIVSNIINAIGGTTHAYQHNFPRKSRFWKTQTDNQNMVFELERLCKSSIDRFVEFERPQPVPQVGLTARNWTGEYDQMSPVDKQFTSLGALYSWLRDAFSRKKIENLFVGKQSSQVNGIFATNGRQDFGALFNIRNAEDAVKGIDLIVEQGEGNPVETHDDGKTHYDLFKQIQNDIANWVDHVRPVVRNPAIRLRDDVEENMKDRVTQICFTDATFTYCVMVVCECLYENLLRLVVGFWASADDSTPETTGLYRMLTGFMKQVFRPIAEALTLLPVVDNDFSKGNAGPSFSYYPSLHLSHNVSTFITILEEQLKMCKKALGDLVEVTQAQDNAMERKFSASFLHTMKIAEHPGQQAPALVHSVNHLKNSWGLFRSAVSKMERSLEGLNVLIEYTEKTFKGNMNN